MTAADNVLLVIPKQLGGPDMMIVTCTELWRCYCPTLLPHSRCPMHWSQCPPLVFLFCELVDFAPLSRYNRRDWFCG